MFRVSRFVRIFLILFSVGLSAEFMAEIAEARAGRGRSMGRSNSRPSQSEQYRSTPNQQGPQATPPMQQPSRTGGFGRALAGGIAGGFLGSMLFSSIGNASTGGGLGGSGFGLIEIILIAGLAFLAFRWWKSRQQMKAAHAGVATSSTSSVFSSSAANTYGQPAPLGHNQGAPMGYAPAAQGYDSLGTGGITQDEASDIFFRIQGAFTRRDLSSVNDALSQEMYREFNLDIEQMKATKRINRLENISVRKVDVLDRWNEAGTEYARVRFTANLLDYVVDETTGQVVEGNAHEPVKFEEDWTFARTTGYAPWQLVGIGQV